MLWDAAQCLYQGKAIRGSAATDMSDAPDFGLIQRQQKQIPDELGEFRDQLTVLTAICMRVEGAVNALTTEVRAVHSRHARLDRRVKELESGH